MIYSTKYDILYYLYYMRNTQTNETMRNLTTLEIQFCATVAILKEMGMSEAEAKREVIRVMNEGLDKMGVA